jgi:hypothetical protein
LKNIYKIIFCAIFILLIHSQIYTVQKTYRVAIKEQASSQIYASLINAIIQESGGIAIIGIFPAPRAEYMLENDLADIQIPQLKIYENTADLKFDFASVTLFETAFVFYCNKDKFIDVAELQHRPDLSIEIDRTLTDAFHLKFSPTNDFEQSINKVSIKRIDGFIMSQFTGDIALRKTGLKNIRRQLFTSASVSITIKKGTVGGEIDRMIVSGYNKLKLNGKYEKIMGELIKKAKYDNWQPQQ